MLFFSNLLILLTLSVTYLFVLLQVIVTGIRSPVSGQFQDLLVLGKSLKQGKTDNDFEQRLDRAARLYRQDTSIRLILLGGQTSPGLQTEACAGSQYLQQQGVLKHSIVLEEASRHTLENLRHARELITMEGHTHIGLLTSRYHLARSLAMAKQLGMRVQPVAAEDQRWPGSPFRLMFEAYLLHWYLTGRYIARWTKDQASLDQIS